MAPAGGAGGSTTCLKLFAAQLHAAAPSNTATPSTPPSGAWALAGRTFSRCWVQGVVVSAGGGGAGGGCWVLDDGSGLVPLDAQAFTKRSGVEPRVGGYYLAIGLLFSDSAGRRALKVHKLVDLPPDREAMWNLEVVEMHREIYSRPEE